MYNANRCSKEFIDGLHYFLDMAEANKRNSFVCCPCIHCQNKKDYSSSRTLHNYIFANGFMSNYISLLDFYPIATRRITTTRNLLQ
jgi:hypothetical protein